MVAFGSQNVTALYHTSSIGILLSLPMVDPSPESPAASPSSLDSSGPPGGPKEAEVAEESPHFVEGTGEAPPPGTRLETVFICFLSLAIVLLPVLSSLRSLADMLRESARMPWLTHSLGFVLHKLVPTDLAWASIYVQNGTVWIGFLGALLAVAGGKHLGLSTTGFMPRGPLRSAAEGFCSTVFVLVTLVLTYAAARMVAVERANGDNDLLPGGVHKWFVQLIIPVVFGLMAPRAAWRALDPNAASGHGAPEAVPHPPMSPRRQKLRWVVSGVVLVLAVAMFVIGFGHDNSPKLQGLVGRVDKLVGLVKWLGIASTGVGFFLGLPVFVVMAGLAMTLFFSAGTPIAALPLETLRLVANPSLPAIPLLTIAGYVLASGRSSHRLVRAYKSVLGWIPGGMAIMVVIVCAVFTTFTGASGVTILALGGLVYPMLVRDGYPKGFSLGMVTAAGSLGLLFPPSLPVILYSVAASAPGSVAPVAVDQLFIGGFLPGLSLVVLVSLYGMYQGHRSNAPRQAFVWKEARSAIWAAKWDIVVPIVVMGSFLSGVATIVESAAIGAAYALIIELVVFRDMHPIRELPAALLHAATLVGAVVVLLGVALGLTNYLVEAEVPTKLVEWVQHHIHSRWVFLLVLNIGLLILGSVLEIYSAIVVLVPLVAPLGVAFDVNPVHLGVIFLCNLELGFLCPPMGLNLFLSATRFHKPLPYLYREAMPFLGIMTIGVLFVTYVPSVTLWLLRVLGKA